MGSRVCSVGWQARMQNQLPLSVLPLKMSVMHASVPNCPSMPCPMSCHPVSMHAMSAQKCPSLSQMFEQSGKRVQKHVTSRCSESCLVGWGR